MTPKPTIVPKRDFIGKPAPPGYIAGVGRGATGFTTRSDLGPARESTNHFASSSSGAGHHKANPKDNDEDEEGEYLNEANYDEFAGYRGSLFNKEDPYDDDDKEADKIYEGFDLHMCERGKARDQALQLKAYRFKRPRIQQQFTDLTEDLKQVTEAEWINLPESGDARNRKQRVGKMDKYTPIPESLLVEQNRLASGGETLVSIDPRTANHPDMETDDDRDNNDEDINNRLLKLQNTETNQSGISGQLVNIGDMNECRSSIISSTLSRASMNVGVGQLAATNREAYLNELNSSGQVKVEDNLEERRKQFKMMLKTATDPDIKTKAYIMYIGLEYNAGKLSNARSLAEKACEECPSSVELWLESIKLHPPDKAKRIVIDAIRAKPRSLKLWLKAAELETSESNKLKIYEKAANVIPTQPEVWRKWAEAEITSKREIILEQAVDNCPNSIDLWISLARLKHDMKSASQIIFRATEHNPTDQSIRIELAKLYERSGDKDSVKQAIAEVVKDFAAKGIDIIRDDWFKDAIEAEQEGFPLTGAAIVRRLLGWDLGHLERDQHKLVEFLLEDANKFTDQNSPACARQAYRSIVNLLRGKATLELREMAWVHWAKFEQRLGTPETMENVLNEATSSPDLCQSSETLWFMLIDLKRSSEPDEIIKKALEKNPNSEKIILAAVQHYCDRKGTKDARRILADACMIRETPRLLMRHAELERSLGNLDEAVRILKVGVTKYRDNPEFFQSLGQIEEQRGNVKQATENYKMGLTCCKTNVELWISLAKLREKTETIPIARSTLEKARRFNDKVAILYVESAKLEIRAFLKSTSGQSGGTRRPNLAESLISEGIRKCKGQPEIETLESMQKLIKERKFAQCL